MTVVLITHDLGVIAQAAEKVAVMYAGKNRGKSAVEDIFADPLHPYTQGLLESIPARCEQFLERGVTSKLFRDLFPVLYNIARSCRFMDRCSYADEECVGKEPTLTGNSPRPFCFLLEIQREEKLIKFASG